MGEHDLSTTPDLGTRFKEDVLYDRNETKAVTTQSIQCGVVHKVVSDTLNPCRNPRVEAHVRDSYRH